MSLERDYTVCEGYEQSGWRRMYVSTAKFRKLLDVVKATYSGDASQLHDALDAYEKEDA